MSQRIEAPPPDTPLDEITIPVDAEDEIFDRFDIAAAAVIALDDKGRLDDAGTDPQLMAMLVEWEKAKRLVLAWMNQEMDAVEAGEMGPETPERVKERLRKMDQVDDRIDASDVDI
ncbi:hypothetical protein C475_08892 [Halosimplex carlsbadense 2-9-1]|uniref:Uncharacterized protein n=1 Tax=Halosimplex carlsbadense 2-9-1 TaxID=797114 RepID=M0CTG9_9EURY|nr:hypothetical protein [Halosimplex carlsbadense]ELZ26530.1 hypothetical protein C475_08892 [Halosimplex carlsbadense 2-9-1]